MRCLVVNYELRRTDLCAEGYALVERGLRLQYMLGGMGGMSTTVNSLDECKVSSAGLAVVPAGYG